MNWNEFKKSDKNPTVMELSKPRTIALINELEKLSLNHRQSLRLNKSLTELGAMGSGRLVV